MHKLQIRNLTRKLIRESKGKTTEYAALIKGNSGVIIPGWQKTRYDYYIKAGYIHVMSGLDGDVLEMV